MHNILHFNGGDIDYILASFFYENYMSYTPPSANCVITESFSSTKNGQFFKFDQNYLLFKLLSVFGTRYWLNYWHILDK